MSSKKKRKGPCPFAVAKKPSKWKKLSNFDKDHANVLAASDRGSYFKQKKLIALDEEEQSRRENETELGLQESWQKLAGLHAYVLMGFFSFVFFVVFLFF